MSRRRIWIVLAALALAAPLGSCAPIEGRETPGQYVDDATITAKVKAEIIKAQSMKGLHISVETMQGTVQLSGFVDTPDQKDQAGKIAAAVAGVKSVQNNLLVKTGK